MIFASQERHAEKNLVLYLFFIGAKKQEKMEDFSFFELL